MQFITTTALIAFAAHLFSVVLAKPITDVVVLGTEDFDKFIKEEQLALVEFYAPCMHMMIAILMPISSIRVWTLQAS